VAELGAPRPGFGDEQLAALAGVAPLEASSAGVTRHRVNRGGNRRLNLALHRIVLTQARMYEPARSYLARRRAEGRTDREARRALPTCADARGPAQRRASRHRALDLPRLRRAVRCRLPRAHPAEPLVAWGRADRASTRLADTVRGRRADRTACVRHRV